MCQDIKSSLFSWSFNHWAYSIVQDKWHQQLRCLFINIPSTIRHQTWPPWNTNDQNRLMSLQAYFDFSKTAKYFSASPSFTIVSFPLSLFWNIFSYFDEFWCINKILSLYYSSDTQKLLPCRTSCLKGIGYIGQIVSNDAYHIINVVVSPCIFGKRFVLLFCTTNEIYIPFLTRL